jgi:hypothetical protein
MGILEIKAMSREEQLSTMELLWDELCQQDPAVESPEWHKGILDERRSIIAEGSATYLTIDQVKKRFRP